MVVIFVGLLVLVDNLDIVLFILCKTYGAGFFVPTQTKVMVKLLKGYEFKICST